MRDSLVIVGGEDLEEVNDIKEKEI